MATKKAIAPKAAVVPLVDSIVTNGSASVTVSVSTPKWAKIFVEVVDNYIDDSNMDGDCMDICNTGLNDIVDLTDQAFENTVALLRKLREEYKKLK